MRGLGTHGGQRKWKVYIHDQSDGYNDLSKKMIRHFLMQS